jgi:hypothetical protein
VQPGEGIGLVDGLGVGLRVGVGVGLLVAVGVGVGEGLGEGKGLGLWRLVPCFDEELVAGDSVLVECAATCLAGRDGPVVKTSASVTKNTAVHTMKSRERMNQILNPGMRTSSPEFLCLRLGTTSRGPVVPHHRPTSGYDGPSYAEMRRHRAVADALRISSVSATAPGVASTVIQDASSRAPLAPALLAHPTG